VGDTFPAGRQRRSLPRKSGIVPGARNRTSWGGCAGSPGGLVGPGRDAGQGGEQGCPGRAQPRAPPTRSPMHSPTATTPLPSIPLKNTPNKPKSASSYTCVGLGPALLLAQLFGGGVTDPRESFGARQRCRVAMGTWTLAQCWRGQQGCPGSPHKSPALPLPAPGSHDGSGSRVCLWVVFVLKRFIIFLTGRFPVSVLVNNCSQLNLHQICVVGMGMGATQRVRISRKPTSGSCCRRGALRWGRGRGIAASRGHLLGMGRLSSPGRGMPAGLLPLYGGKIHSWWGKSQQDGSQPCGFAAPLTLRIPALPTPSLSSPGGRVSAGWAGRA